MLYLTMLAVAEVALIIWLLARVMRLQGDLHYCRACHRAAAEAHLSCESALHKIAAQETPGANATAKRMARIAREALS
jgi:hypothetical protein